MKHFRSVTNANALARRFGGGVSIPPAFVANLKLLGNTTTTTFIMKYDTSGNIKWVNPIPTGASFTSGTFGYVAANSTGVYFCGVYSNGPITLVNSDGSSSSYTLPAYSGQQSFLVKYDTSGIVKWGVSILPFDYALSLCPIVVTTDSTGIYVAGEYTAGPGLDEPLVVSNADGGGSVTLPGTTGSSDGFLVKYNTSGVVQWAALLGGIYFDYGNAVATDSTGVYLAGQYTNATTPLVLSNAGGIASSYTLPVTALADAFLVKYNTSGSVQWAVSISGNGANDSGNAVATDSTGVYLAGQYSNTTTPLVLSNAGGSASSYTLPASSGTDAFLVKYNTSGSVQWAASIKGTSTDSGFAVATDSTSVYSAGLYNSSSPITLLNADGGSSGKTLPAGTGSFLVKYDTTSGSVQSVAAIPTLGGSTGRAILVDTTGIYLGGFYRSPTLVPLINAY